MRPAMKDIAKATAAHYRLSKDQLFSPSRFRRTARARQVAMYLCRELTGRSLLEIGSFLGNRDHTTVLHAARYVCEEAKLNPRIRDAVAAITAAAKAVAAERREREARWVEALHRGDKFMPLAPPPEPEAEPQPSPESLPTSREAAMRLSWAQSAKLSTLPGRRDFESEVA